MAEFLIGLAIGVVLGAYLTWDRYIRHEPATIELKITPEVADQIVGRTIHEWLSRRNLVVMPKGREFVWPGEVKS